MIVVYAEMHTPLIRDMIEDDIIEAHDNTPFDYILSEEAGDNAYFTQPELQKAINDKMYSISDRSFKLGIRLHLPVIGIDYWKKLPKSYSIQHIHKLRESQMTSVIKSYMPKGNLCILIGAAHIRAKNQYKDNPTESSVYTLLHNNAEIRIYTDTNYDYENDIASTNKNDIKITITDYKGVSGMESVETLPTKNLRKTVESYILNIVNTMDPSGFNDDYYKKLFKSMDDKAFDVFMQNIRDGKQRLSLLVPNMVVNLKIANLITAADKVGVELFERIRLWDSATKQYYLTAHKYLVSRLPIRRVKQFLMDKLSVPESDTKTDLLTGQVIKPDKGSAISLVEMQTMIAKGLDKSIVELMAVRGGNPFAYAAYKASIADTGLVKLSELRQDNSVRSAVVASVYFKSMHLANNLVE